jgi:DNA replication and repair protein RecF
MGTNGAIIASLQLDGFRSYNHESFEFSNGVNIIVGPNASGKSNLLEAILIVSRGNSYRAKDSEVVAFKRDTARLEATMSDNSQRIVQLTKEGEVIQKQFKIDSQTLKRLNINKTLPCVVFEPNHLLILNGSPVLRRKYLDDLLEQTEPGYSTTRRQYLRSLAQRNFLLKSGHHSKPGSIFAWNVRLSELGGKIAQHRITLINEINNKVQKRYRLLSDSRENIALEYKTNFSFNSYASELLRKLETNEDDDFRRGFTPYGPHHDDLVVYIDNHPVQQSASRGESRTIMLVFKIIEADIIENVRGKKPLLLLDDVFSELDGARRKALTKFLQPFQAFITTTDADIVLHHFGDKANIIPL